MNIGLCHSFQGSNFSFWKRLVLEVEKPHSHLSTPTVHFHEFCLRPHIFDLSSLKLLVKDGLMEYNRNSSFTH